MVTAVVMLAIAVVLLGIGQLIGIYSDRKDRQELIKLRSDVDRLMRK